MILVKDVTLHFGERTLLDEVSFAIRQGEKVGLIGRNGAGKSTLLKMIAGKVQSDGGSIDIPGSLGYLRQEISIDPSLTVMAAARTAFERIGEIHRELDKTIDLLTHTQEDDKLLALSEKMGELYHELEHLGEATMEGDIEKVLKGLGFDESMFEKPVGQLSGGWQMRVELAKLLLSRPDYLLLDEPTNHLDMPSIIWLERYLKNSDTGILLVSHDKRFLDQLTNRTIEISMGRIYDMPFPYTRFMEERQKLREIQLASFQNQQKEIERKEKLIDRFRAKATKASMAKSLEKQLDKIEIIEIEEEDTATMKVRFPVMDRSPRTMVSARHLDQSFGPKQVLKGIDFELERNEKIAFVGQNGQGKTTLARLIAGQLVQTGGVLEINEKVQIGYYAQNQTELFDTSKTVLQTMEDMASPEVRTRVRAILGAFLFSGEDVGKKVSVLSGGERARLALACMILSETNLLIMDEPTHHLDILAKQRLKDALLNYPGALIIISHDRDFLTGLSTRTIEFAAGQVKEYLGDIDEMLSKKGLENLVQIDLAQSAKQDKAGKAAVQEQLPVKDNQEDKKLQKQIQQVEKEIQQLENVLKAKESELAGPSAYGTPGYEEAVSVYESTKKKLEELTESWEKLVEQTG